MGAYHSEEERREAELAQRRAMAQQARNQQGERRKLALKIVSQFIDEVNKDIIRPGPLAEERECYDMAQELRDHGPKLIEIVLAQLNVNKGCS